jgi:hypothetical protein
MPHHQSINNFNAMKNQNTLILGFGLFLGLTAVFLYFSIQSPTNAKYIEIGQIKTQISLNQTHWTELESRQVQLHNENETLRQEAQSLEETLFQSTQ